LNFSNAGRASSIREKSGVALGTKAKRYNHHWYQVGVPKQVG